MARTNPATKSRRTKVDGQLGFAEPIPMRQPSSSPGVIGTINLYNRLVSQMQAVSAAPTSRDDESTNTDIAYFNY